MARWFWSGWSGVSTWVVCSSLPRWSGCFDLGDHDGITGNRIVRSGFIHWRSSNALGIWFSLKIISSTSSFGNYGFIQPQVLISLIFEIRPSYGTIQWTRNSVICAFTEGRNVAAIVLSSCYAPQGLLLGHVCFAQTTRFSDLFKCFKLVRIRLYSREGRTSLHPYFLLF